MATARELALEFLPHFAECVQAKRVYSYGHYAAAVGRNVAKESIVIGQAMHAIGAACVFCAVPVAPLFYVERADGEWRGVFESYALELVHVLPHYDLLYVTAREYDYVPNDFQRVEKALREVLPKHAPDWLSPHDLWRVAIVSKTKDGRTIFERALERYEAILAAAKMRRAG